MGECLENGCSRSTVGRGLCAKHYRQARRKGLLTGLSSCSVEGCTGLHYAKGLCDEHYHAWKLHGDPKVRKRLRRGKGGARKNGYQTIIVKGLHVWEHRHVMEQHLRRPLREKETVFHINGVRNDNRIENLQVRKMGSGTLNKYGYRILYVDGKQIGEHRYVMEQHLGRSLLPEESVHHINGVREDNRVENLELWSKAQPSGQRVTDKLAWAREIISLYEGLGDGLPREQSSGPV